MKSVYIIGSHELGYYKIGRCSNVKKRLASIAVGCPYEVEVIARWAVADEKQLEAYLHAQFLPKHVRGEWFALTSSDLKSCDGLVAGFLSTDGIKAWGQSSKEETDVSKRLKKRRKKLLTELRKINLQ